MPRPELGGRVEILTADQMRRVDRRAIAELGIPSLRLMEAAGAGIAGALRRDLPDLAARPLVVLCGKGNNGGDGLVVARHLALAGLRPEILVLAAAAELSPDAAVQLSRVRALGLPVHHVTSEDGWRAWAGSLGRSSRVVDALLGTGIQGGARGLAAVAIAALHGSEAEVVAVDLPSGLDADTGAVPGPAAAAARTYTLGRPKPCLVLEPAATRAGAWSVIDIGIPDAAVAEERAALSWTDGREAARLLPRRPRDGHKGTFGHLLVVAGSTGKSGAAVLVARGALRAGVGLVTVACPAAVRAEVAVQQAEVMTEPLPEEGAEARMLALSRDRDALAIGPGLGTAEETGRAVRALLSRRSCPAVLDADGLNVCAGVELRAQGPLVLTPHPGEAARLAGTGVAEIQADRLGHARRLAEATGAVVLLKGRRTVVAAPDGRAAFNATGNPGMGTAGTGDVLTGVVGALLARGLPPFDAARLAAYVHGDAGDRAAQDLGEEGLLASDLAKCLPAAFRSLA